MPGDCCSNVAAQSLAPLRTSAPGSPSPVTLPHPLSSGKPSSRRSPSSPWSSTPPSSPSPVSSLSTRPGVPGFGFSSAPPPASTCPPPPLPCLLLTRPQSEAVRRCGHSRCPSGSRDPGEPLISSAPRLTVDGVQLERQEYILGKVLDNIQDEDDDVLLDVDSIRVPDFSVK
jgi:hypothetical protein